MDVNSNPCPQEIVVDPSTSAPQAPNGVQNGTSTQQTPFLHLPPEEIMAESDVNSTPGTQIQEAHTSRMAEIGKDNSTNAPQVPNEVLNRTSTRLKPSLHLLSIESGHGYAGICLPLYRAALKGDWGTAKGLIRQDPSILSAAITKGHETVLHIAAGARQTDFVKELLKEMEPQELTLIDKNKNSAFFFAAAAGATQIAMLMLEKNPSLLRTRGAANVTAVYMAALLAHRDMASYLYRKLKNQNVILSREDKISLFFTCLHTGLYDLTMELLNDAPYLAMARDVNQDTALHILARNPSSFAVRNRGLFKRLMCSFPGMKLNCSMDSISVQAIVRCLWDELSKKVDLEHTDLTRIPSNFVFDAAKLGNFEFLHELICRYPDLVYEVDGDNYSIFHIAVLNRHTNIFSLIYETGLAKDVITTYEDEEGNNILHLAAKFPHPSRVSIVSGAALQMQRELIWFKAIEKIVQPSLRTKKNAKGETPQELFTEQHKELLGKGEMWMQKTAKSCMLVATLIATVIFAAAFAVPGGYDNTEGFTAASTVPGGNDDTEGLPILRKHASFKVFAVSDAIALSSSSISILMFLSILTSRYAEGDFLQSLPFKLLVGLSTLFISMISMMIAFSSTFFLACHDRFNWVTILTTTLVFVPTTLFVLLQYPLLRDIFCSTYRSRYLFKPSKSIL